MSTQRKHVSKHTEVTPLRFDGQKFPPASKGWTAEIPPENMSVIRVMCLRLSDGTSKIFRLLVPRRISKQDQTFLRQRAAAKLAEVLRENNDAHTVAVVRKERKFLKTKPRTLPNKVARRLRKKNSTKGEQTNESFSPRRSTAA